MSSKVKLDVLDNIAAITIDNPPINAYTQTVRSDLISAIESVESEQSVAAVIITANGPLFSGGMDINEFQSGFVEPGFRDLLERIEKCNKIVVAGIQGNAFGGGFELAMWSHYRCAAAGASLSLPEIKLGLLPGGGGTQRLPRLAGVQKALEMCLSGKPVSASEALELGVIDRLVENDFLSACLEFTRELVENKAGARRLREMEVTTGDLDTGFFEEHRAKQASDPVYGFAGKRIIDCVEASTRLPYAEADVFELASFMECMASPQSQSLVHLFFAERQAPRVTSIKPGVTPRSIHSVAIIGAGTMGGGIAMNFANIGVPVQLLELNDGALEKGLGIIRKNYESTVKKGRLSREKADERIGLIKGTTNYTDIADADLVIEAVFENMEIKQQVFTALDSTMKPGAILATNTSTLDVNKIAAVTKRPQEVIGLHFFSPANIMRLLEVIRTDSTADDVILTCMELAKKIKKVAVLSRVCFGFIGNRMVTPYVREADLLLLEGATPSQVDKALTDFGFAMGPCAVNDLAGVDIGYKLYQENRDILPDDPRFTLIRNRLGEMGRFGQKTGAGYFHYDAGSRKPVEDPVVLELIETESKKLGIERREIGSEEIVERCTYALVNEGAMILDEWIAQRSSDLDIVYVYGYGFPSYRGGPMHYADSVGLDRVLFKIREFQEKDPGFWVPSPLLERLVAEGKSFSDTGVSK